MAVRDARKAWRKAREHRGEATLRKAFRSAVLAARTLRKAAAVSPHDAQQILDEAERVEAAAHELKAKLARTSRSSTVKAKST